MSPPISSELVDAWRARARARERESREHIIEVRARLGQIVRVLVDGYGARRVVLFGSVARGDASPSSDVDVLVEGVPIDRITNAHVAVLDALPGLWVDLVPAELARPEVLARALREGETLYAR